MFGMGIWELIVILIIVLVVFGAKRLPELGEGLGKFVSGLRNGLQNESDKDPDEHKS
ncbi:MAG: twin-arginine translocase TatA/TatE family subunit [Mariprofundales bacterium]|nr:twin-arginine translocase TatA/TatE family subunit [Mariprofundales bacterium]